MSLNTNRTFFENDVIKDELEKMMYMDSGITSNALVLTGPNVKRHIRNLRRTICTTSKSSITIAEIDDDVYATQKKWFGSESVKKHIKLKRFDKESGAFKDTTVRYDKNVKLFNDDIMNASPERFIDADLMATVNTVSRTVTNLLTQQKEVFAHSKLRKGLIFTFSMRTATMEQTLHFIKNLLKVELGATVTFLSKISMYHQKVTFNHMYIRYKTIISGGRVKVFRLYYYNSYSGHPMMTGLIVYK